MTVCAVCGEQNPERARFCLSCGTPLVAEGPARREERKLVSVLFCDLVGFTARSDNADPEDVRATLRPYHAALRKDIERFGGTVEKFIGDAVMAVFGAPVAHEDDAERAVRAALRIIDTIGELNEEHPELDLSVRIGVNTGEAVVAVDARPQEGEGIVTGDVVNTAARLQTVAPVGCVVVGEATYRSTKDLVTYEALDPVTVKGKAEPVPMWRAVTVRSRYGVDVEQGTRTPFVGRAAEFALLTQSFARAVDESSVHLVTITGEPGVGKTRLLYEFRRHLDDQPDLVYWRQGRCLPYGEGVTFWALGEMVKAQAGVLETDPPEDALAKLDAALAVLSEDAAEREWLRARLAPLLGVAEGEGSRDEAFAAWLRFLEAIASRQPLVLVFEDLHWADDPFVGFVEHLVEWSSGVPLFVIASARPELYERHPGWGGGKRNSTTISLGPLSEADTARLVSALLEQAVLPAEVQSELLDRAGGNPLYAEEFVRMLLDRGYLERHGASLRLSVDPRDIALPETVHALIGARLDTLPPARKALLLDASVLGKVFWSGAVASMGGVEEREVRDGLHDLARKEFVRTVRKSSVEGEAEYSFWHALVRDVAYGQIPRAERAAKHVAAAEWTERTVGERIADHAEFLAHHYERAIELRTATGQEPDADLRRRAAKALELAAERAMRLDVRNAVELYRRAEELLPEGDVEHAVVRAQRLAAAGNLGEASVHEQVEAFEAAVASLLAASDRARAAAMLTEFSSFLKVTGSTDRAVALNDQAIQLLEPLGPSRELAVAYGNRAGQAMMVGRLAEWRDAAEVALEMAERLDLPPQRSRVLQFRGIHRIMTGDVDGGRVDLEDALRIGLENGLGRETALAYNNLADWLAWLDGPEASLAVYEEGMTFAARRGLDAGRIWMRGETTWRLFDAGRWDEVLEAAEAVRAWFPEGRGQPVVISGTMEARVRALRGDLSTAARMMEEYLPPARETGDVQSYRPALTTAALVAFDQGRREDARRLTEELADALETATSDRVYGMLDGVMLARKVDDRRLAERIASIDPSILPRHRVGIGHAVASEAELLEARGDAEAASRKFVEAAEIWRDVGHVFHLGLALLGQARCLATTGRSTEAVEPADEAARIFAALRASSLAAEAASLAGDASAVGS